MYLKDTSGKWSRGQTKIRLYENDRKSQVWRPKGSKAPPSSVTHGDRGVTVSFCMAVKGTGSLVFIDDVTIDSSSRMDSNCTEASYLFICSTKSYSKPMIPNIIRKQQRSFGKPKIWPSNSPDLTPTERVFDMLKRKLKTSSLRNKHELKMAAVQAWQSITRLQAVIACKGYETKYLTLLLSFTGVCKNVGITGQKAF